MLKKSIQRFLPEPNKLLKGRSLRIFGRFSQNHSLWHLNRRSASGACAVGLFVAFLPIPAQMLLAASLAILLRVNLPLSVVLVWVTNPLTITPVMYGSYRMGLVLLRHPPHGFHFEWNLEWLQSSFKTVLPPILVGSVFFGTLAAIIGYTSVRLLWRQSVRKNWKTRATLRKERALKRAEAHLPELNEPHKKQDTK